VQERWSAFQMEMMKECEVLSQIHQSLQSLKSEGADVVSLRILYLNIAIGDGERK
jgi:hypothetical protein